MSTKIIRMFILMVVLISLGSCVKNSKSNQSGVIEKYQDGTYYFKVLGYKDIRDDDNSRYKYTVHGQKGCVICRSKCNPDNREEISVDNVDKICNLDVKMLNCERVGFDEKNKTYSEDKDILSKDVLVKNNGDKIQWYEYFEELNNIFDEAFEKDESGICIKESSNIVIFDTTWEEIVENSIYKLQHGSTYYHATDEKLYASQKEAETFCSGLKDQDLEWKLISGSEFDLANEKNMAIRINYRMKIGLGQCFFTSDGGLKTFSDNSEIIEKCQKETQGRVICVANK